MSLEDQGLRFFEDSSQKLRTRLMLDKSRAADSKETDVDLFFIDSKGHAAEDNEMQPVDAAAWSMKSPASNGRKRKELGGKEEAPVKFIKYKVHDPSTKDYLSSSVADGGSSGSEVDNPPSDDEMEEN